MKKGFTLIELLAVILILGVIALISVPVVSNIIESSEKGAVESSMMSYVDATEKKAMLAEVTSSTKLAAGTYSVDELNNMGVKVKGEYPSDTGIFVINNEGRVLEGWATYKDGKYKVYYDGTYAVADKDNYLDKSGEQHNLIPEPGTPLDEITQSNGVVYAANAITKMTQGVLDYRTLNRLSFLRYTFANSAIAKTEACVIAGNTLDSVVCFDTESLGKTEEYEPYFSNGGHCYLGESYSGEGQYFECYKKFTISGKEHEITVHIDGEVDSGVLELGYEDDEEDGGDIQTCYMDWRGDLEVNCDNDSFYLHG